jgi:hypothetical protein|tara:strand:+ start:5019 stop:5219 length:201 start_codon:yes stop_codon:yes gene_type:complete
LFSIAEQGSTSEVPFLLMKKRWHKTDGHDYGVVPVKEFSPSQTNLFPFDMVIKPNAVTWSVVLGAL